MYRVGPASTLELASDLAFRHRTLVSSPERPQPPILRCLRVSRSELKSRRGLCCTSSQPWDAPPTAAHDHGGVVAQTQHPKDRHVCDTSGGRCQLQRIHPNIAEGAAVRCDRPTGIDLRYSGAWRGHLLDDPSQPSSIPIED